MSKFESILSDAEIVDIVSGLAWSSADTLGFGKEVAEHIQQAVLARLHEQEPLAWYVNNDITFDQQTADSWKKNLFIVKPLYAHPVSASTIESTLEQEVLEMVRMLEAREWADHVGQSDLGKRLEWVISTLHNELSRPQACVSPTSDKTVCDSQNTKCATQTNYQANPGSSKYCDGNLGLGLARYQPCGCMVCYCENQNQCLGCGAKHCGTHDLGEIPNPVYVDHIPDGSNMVFDPGAALTLAERMLSIEITEPLADEIVQFARKLHEKYAQTDHIPDTGKMIVPESERRRADSIALEYRLFTDWCRANPSFDLDSRLHTHSGNINNGGYISDEKTRIAFAAWRAAKKALAAAPKCTGDSNE